MPAYSFADVVASITGPGGQFQLGAGAGVGDEGITTSMIEDKNTMVIGADGTVQHTLNAGNAGRTVVNLLKTSPVNAKLQRMYDLQKTASALWGKNIITINNRSSGDNITNLQAAFRKLPDQKQQKAAGMVAWEFDTGSVDTVLGTFTGVYTAPNT